MAGKSRRVGIVTRLVGGKIITDYVEPVDSETIQDMRLYALSTPYEPMTSPDGEILAGEHKYIGYTKAEVMALREAQMAAEGDMEAIRHTHDRILGKPKQQIDNINVSISYKDFLDNISNGEATVQAIAPSQAHLPPPPPQRDQQSQQSQQSQIIDVTSTYINAPVQGYSDI